MLRKVVVGVALAGLIAFGAGTPVAQAAAKKVDCDKVMSELNGGKKPAEVAKEMGISRGSVYRCRRAAAKSAKGETEKKAPAEAPSPAPSPAGK